MTSGEGCLSGGFIIDESSGGVVVGVELLDLG